MMHLRRDKFWISPGARLWSAALTCAIALAIVFVVIPARQTQARQQQLIAQRTIQQRQGDALLHRFDCTYGIASRLAIAESVRTAHAASHTALISRHAQLKVGNRRAANAALGARQNYQRAEAQYRMILKSLKPLDPTPTKC